MKKPKLELRRLVLMTAAGIAGMTAFSATPAQATEAVEVEVVNCATTYIQPNRIELISFANCSTDTAGYCIFYYDPWEPHLIVPETTEFVGCMV